MRVGALLPLALGALLAIAFAVAAPTAAIAQDPGYDQYTPTPDGGGNAPDKGTNGSGNNNGSTPVPNSGDGSGGTGTSGGTDSGTTAPSTTAPGATTPGSTDTSGPGTSGNKDDRALAQFAGDAGKQRDQRQAANGTQGAQQQLSSATPSGGSGGIGLLVWVALGAIVLWALVSGVVNYRRRRSGDGHPPRRRRGHSKEQTA